MLERTDAITNAVLEPITFVLAYPTVHISTKNNTNPLKYTSVVLDGNFAGGRGPGTYYP